MKLMVMILIFAGLMSMVNNAPLVIKEIKLYPYKKYIRRVRELVKCLTKKDIGVFGKEDVEIISPLAEIGALLDILGESKVASNEVNYDVLILWGHIFGCTLRNIENDPELKERANFTVTPNIPRTLH